MATGQELIRLTTLSRETSPESLLGEALAGHDRTVENVKSLFGFIVTNFGQEGSAVTEKFWRVIEPFLKESGFNDQQLKKIRYPFPKPGDKHFRSILDEMRAEGHDV